MLFTHLAKIRKEPALPLSVAAAFRPNVSTKRSCRQASILGLVFAKFSSTESTIRLSISPAEMRSWWIIRASSECSVPASSAIACHLAHANVHLSSSADLWLSVLPLGHGNCFIRGFHATFREVDGGMGFRARQKTLGFSGKYNLVFLV